MATSLETLLAWHLQMYGGGGSSYVGVTPISGPITGAPGGSTTSPPSGGTDIGGSESPSVVVTMPEMVFDLSPIILAEEMIFNLSDGSVGGEMTFQGENGSLTIGPITVISGESGGATNQLKSTTLKFSIDGVNISLDAILGTSGGDFIESAGLVYGGAGNDTLVGNWQSDLLKGGTGSDVLNGREGGDVLDGGEGFDFANYWNSGEGVFVSLASPQGNTGQAAGDVFVSIEGLEGSQFGDTLVGDWQANIVRGFTGDDVLNGREGKDTLDGGEGSDTADYFNAGSGVVASLAAASSNLGEAAGDVYISIENLTGSWHGDSLTGDGHGNTLKGLGGDDFLIGNEGNDVLWGGAGRDVFSFASALNANSNVDRILDFNPTDDLIWLNRQVFTIGVTGGALQAGAFKIGAAASAAEHRIIYNSTTGDLFFDKDGWGAAAQVKFGNVGANVALTSADFWLIG